MKKSFLLGFAIMISGCVSSIESLQTEMAGKGIQPLDATQTQTLYAGSTTHFKGKTFEYAGFRYEDGTMKGKAWGDWGEETDTGTWMVNDDGHLCSEWDGVWAKGLRCFQTYPGESENQYVEVIVVGQKSKSTPSGIYHVTITPGDSTEI